MPCIFPPKHNSVYVNVIINDFFLCHAALVDEQGSNSDNTLV